MKNKREILAGKAHAALRVLATLPAAQRKGAGTAGLTWGLRKADELDLPVYLVSSGMGRSVYAKHGFEEVSALTDQTLALELVG
jgi:GNAT superfamily N-acetyltransferase